MRSITGVAIAGLLSLGPASMAGAGDVQVAIRDGRVSIVARNATVAEILAEWARVGQMKVENLQAAPRDPMTIELDDISEQRAIATVLRRAGGYIATRRSDGMDAAVSSFERILVMAASAPIARPAPAAASAAALADPADAGQSGEATAERAAAYLIATGQADRAAAGLPAVDQTVDVQGVDQAPARDRRIPPDPTPPAPPQPDGMVPLFEPVVAGPGIDTTPGDPASQEAFRRRRALETVDPSKIKFPQPAAPPKKPGGR